MRDKVVIVFKYRKNCHFQKKFVLGHLGIQN